MSQVTSVPNLVILGWWEVGPKKFHDAAHAAHAHDAAKLMANSLQAGSGRQKPESRPKDKHLFYLMD